MFVSGLSLDVTSSTDFKIRSFTSINNFCCYGLDFPFVVARSDLDNLDMYVCITFY